MELKDLSDEELNRRYAWLDMKIREAAKWGKAMENYENQQILISIEIGRRRREGNGGT